MILLAGWIIIDIKYILDRFKFVQYENINENKRLNKWQIKLNSEFIYFCSKILVFEQKPRLIFCLIKNN